MCYPIFSKQPTTKLSRFGSFDILNRTGQIFVLLSENKRNDNIQSQEVKDMADLQSVLVTGSTGKQGGAAARALMKAGYKVRALTRNPSSPAAIGLRDAGAEVVAGDMLQEESLTKALKDVGIVFSMTTSFQSTHENEVKQGTDMVDAAKAAGVSHFVFTSVASADRSTGIPHFETKYKIEQYLVRSEIPHTIIGPTAFMENFIQPFALPNLRQGKLSRALPASRPMQLVAVEDIGSFAAFVIQHPKDFLGKRIDIAGDERTGEETASVLSKAAGKPIRYESFPPESLRTQNADMAIMMEWQAKNSYKADIRKLRRDYPEVGWHTLEGWAAGIDWNALMAS